MLKKKNTKYSILHDRHVEKNDYVRLQSLGLKNEAKVNEAANDNLLLQHVNNEGSKCVIRDQRVKSQWLCPLDIKYMIPCKKNKIKNKKWGRYTPTKKPKKTKIQS